MQATWNWKGFLVEVSAELPSHIIDKLEIILSAPNKPIILQSEQYIINQDDRLHRESVTADCSDDAITGLLEAIATDDSVDVCTAVSPNDAEVN